MKPLRIFIGYDHAEEVTYHVLCSSIMRRATVPVSITPVALRHLSHVLQRPRDPLQSNDFAFSRWLVPWMAGFEGQALFMDCDMLVRDDIANLFAQGDDTYAVQVVKHDHQPKAETKYLGTTQTRYAKKNWSSVMLFNCEQCTALTPEYVNAASGLDLHQFKWLEGDWKIGDLPLEWNFLVDYYPNQRSSTICNFHYTEGGPYFQDYKDCSYGDLWWEEYDYMRSCMKATHRSINFEVT